MSTGKTSIRYFTGTGNSKRIGALCAEEFAAAGYEVDIETIISEKAPLDEAELACFVFPVYALELPRIVKRYLSGLPKRSSVARSLLIVTGGNPDDCGWSLDTGKRLLAERGYDPSYAELVRMPNNWGTFMRVPEKAEAEEILKAGEAKTREAARAFLAGERYAKPINLDLFGPLGSRLMREGFKLGVKRLWMRFSTTADCEGCGLCARACPTGSITMMAKKPHWSVSCEQCLRCFNVCPSKAIRQLEAIGHGSTHARYIEPHFKPLIENSGLSHEP